MLGKYHIKDQKRRQVLHKTNDLRGIELDPGQCDQSVNMTDMENYYIHKPSRFKFLKGLK